MFRRRKNTTKGQGLPPFRHFFVVWTFSAPQVFEEFFVNTGPEYYCISCKVECNWLGSDQIKKSMCPWEVSENSHGWIWWPECTNHCSSGSAASGIITLTNLDLFFQTYSYPCSCPTQRRQVLHLIDLSNRHDSQVASNHTSTTVSVSKW